MVVVTVNRTIIPTSSSTIEEYHQSSQSPFFLYSGDHSGLILVSHIFIGPNYNTWARATQMALNVKDKLGFIDDTIVQPLQEEGAIGIWSMYNMVTSWLLSAVSKKIADSLLYLNTAEAVWIDLRYPFQQSNTLCVFQIKRQLQNLL